MLINDFIAKLKAKCFFFLGEGGHGYLKDWLWWGGLLTSKFIMNHYDESILNYCTHK